MSLLKNRMVIALLICLIAGFKVGFSQDLLWKANFTGAGNNFASKSAIDLQNNIYVLGYFNNSCSSPTPNLSTRGADDIFIAKYDPNGNLIWARSLGSISSDLGTGIVVSPDGEYIYITGIFLETCYADNNWQISNTGSSDTFLAKYDKNGNIIWLKNIGSASVATAQRPNDLKIDKNNNLIIGGLFIQQIKLGNSTKDTTLYTTQSVGMFIAKLDTTGAVIKAYKFESSNINSRFYTFDTDASGYYLTGFYNGNLVTDLGTYSSNNASLDMFIYKLDFNLDSKWIIKAAGTANDHIYSCSVDNNGNFYVGGHFASNQLVVDSLPDGTLSKKTGVNKTTNGKTDIFFAKYKHDGTLQWFNTAGSTENDYLYRALYNNGNFIAAGQYGATLEFNNKKITPKNTADAFAIIQNQYDNLVYLIPFGGVSGSEIGETAVVDNNGNFVVIGDYNSSRLYINNKDSLDNSNPGTRDMFVAKFDKASVDSVLVQPTCPGASTGSIYLTPIGTLVEPITYAWTKDGDASFTANTKNISNLTAGTYRVTFTDNLGYSKTKSFILKDPASISIVLNSSFNVSCYGGSNGVLDIDVTGGSAPYAYAWETVGGAGLNAIIQDQTTLSAGSYSVQVTDKNGCTATLNDMVLTQPGKIHFKGTTVTRINGGLGSVNLSVQGGTPAYSYSWASAGFTASTEDLSGLTTAGNYTVTVTDAKSCHKDTTVFVADSHVLNAYLGSKQNVLCKGGNTGNITILTENVTGTAQYNWSPNVGNTATVTNLTAGNYSVTVTDDKSFPSVVNVTISEPESALAISVSKANITCNNANNGVLDANPSGGTAPYVFNWTKEAQPFDGGDETQINLSEGTYAVTVTDDNNCKASTTQIITNPAQITFTGTIKGVTCEGAKNDGAITLSNIQGGAGSYTFVWSNGLTTQDATLLSANNYTVTVTDANNCKASNNYVVGYAAPITISFNPTNVTCNGSGNGTLEAVITGGYDGFTYNWSTGATTSSISSLVPGSYSVTVTDSKLCVKTATGTITEPAVLSIGSVNQANILCYGVNNGSIALNVTGGTPQYNYSWDQGAGTSATASNLPAGTFNVTVTDANNCTTNGTYIITQPAALGLAEDINAHVNPLCNGLSTGSITLTPTGGSGEYELSVNNGEWNGNTVLTNLSAGNYNIKLRDKNAITCEFSLSQAISITQPEAISIVSATSLNATQKNPWNGSINIVATGGTSPLSFTLDKGAIQQETGSFADLGPDNYTISITDANNCAPVTSQLLTISDATSISMVDGSSLKIFPIPATDFIKIEYNNPQSNKPLHIVLYSISGKLMYEDKVPAETFLSGYQIDVTQMPKGVYILKVNDAATKEKVIIQ